MRKTKRSKIIAIITVWLIYMLVVGVILYSAASRDALENLHGKLRNQADVVAGQVPTLLENAFYSQYALGKMQPSKVDALTFALEDIGTIEEAKGFLEDYEQSAGINGLAVYDQDGTLLYSSKSLAGKRLDQNTHIYENDLSTFEMISAHPDVISQFYFSSANYRLQQDQAEDGDDGAAKDDENDAEETLVTYVEANRGKWVLLIDFAVSDTQQMVQECFDWREALQNIKTGNEPILLAVDENDGMVLSDSDHAAWGRSVERLELQIGKEDRPASLADLKEALGEPNAIIRMKRDGKDYWAIRLNVDNVLMLMMTPDKGFRDILKGAVTIRALFLLLVTGICVIYTCFQIKGTNGKAIRFFGRFAWDRHLSGRLSACAALMCTAALLSSLFMETVFTRAEVFDYNRKKAWDAAYLYLDNSYASQTLQNWFDEEYMTRCRIARTILGQIQPEEMTWDYLESLSKSLSVKYIYVFDADGRIVADNSPYDRLTIGHSDPFYKLLEGCPEMTGEITVPGTPDETLKRAGASLLDGDHNCTGLVMIVMDKNEMDEIKDNLGLGNAFEQLCLADGTGLIVVNGKDRTIAGNAEVRDGVYGTSLDFINYTGYPISTIGLNEDVLQDDYNGIFHFLGGNHSVSVQRLGEFFFLVFTSRFHLEAANLVYAGFVGFAVLLFMALAMVVSCPMKSGEEACGSASEEANTGKKAVVPIAAHNTTPYFEERWPRDVTRWRDKTPDEQFWIVLKLVLSATFVAIFVNAYVARENSVWYYILIGQWGTGINLHSVTTCLFYVCMLMMLKALIHKLLYITARSVGARTETVCRLLDSALGYILAIVSVFICLGKLGVNTAALSLTAGVAGVIFSIGCQSIVADIIAGFLMTFEGIVQVGDFLIFNDKPEVVLSIGVRTTRLKFFGDVTVVRNNEFKNYVLRAGDKDARVSVPLAIDFGESLERVEGILKEELPKIHAIICDKTDTPVDGPNYIGVTKISEYGVQLSFSASCKGKDVFMVTNTLNRELKLMCEHHRILIAHRSFTNQSRVG